MEKNTVWEDNSCLFSHHGHFYPVKINDCVSASLRSSALLTERIKRVGKRDYIISWLLLTAPAQLTQIWYHLLQFLVLLSSTAISLGWLPYMSIKVCAKRLCIYRLYTLMFCEEYLGQHHMVPRHSKKLNIYPSFFQHPSPNSQKHCMRDWETYSLLTYLFNIF